MKSIAQTLSCVLLAGTIMAGCSKPVAQKVPMTNPPAFGSKAEWGNVKTFLAGRWGVEIYIDPNAAKLPGMDAIMKEFQEEAKNQKIVDVFDFKEDGTFRLSGATSGHKVEGKWGEQTGLLILSFDTLDGKPFQDRMAEIKKEEESGREASLYSALAAENLEQKLKMYQQLKLSDDKKLFTFQGPGMLGGMEDTGFRLVRLAKAEK